MLRARLLAFAALATLATGCADHYRPRYARPAPPARAERFVLVREDAWLWKGSPGS
jgi:hypothetical protein